MNVKETLKNLMAAKTEDKRIENPSQGIALNEDVDPLNRPKNEILKYAFVDVQKINDPENNCEYYIQVENRTEITDEGILYFCINQVGTDKKGQKYNHKYIFREEPKNGEMAIVQTKQKNGLYKDEITTHNKTQMQKTSDMRVDTIKEILTHLENISKNEMPEDIVLEETKSIDNKNSSINTQTIKPQ